MLYREFESYIYIYNRKMYTALLEGIFLLMTIPTEGTCCHGSTPPPPPPLYTMYIYL